MVDPTAVIDNGGGACSRPMTESAFRVAGATVGAAVLALPWVAALGVEETVRILNGSNENYRMRSAGWSYFSMVYNDAASLVSQDQSYNGVRWSFPEAMAHDMDGVGLVSLTIDDAPGDNPEVLTALLDMLNELKVQATFFCTTRLIRGPMTALMQRAVLDGHEVANHCPEDKSYFFSSEVDFEAALDESNDALESYQITLEKQAQNITWLANASKRWKWFRPPMGHQSRTMQSVLQRKGYSSVLGDVFSNDCFIGGTQCGRAAGQQTVKWNVEFSETRSRAGSVVIFHVPQATQRLASVDIIRGFIEASAAKGLKCTTLSGVASAVDRNINARAPGLAAE
jgi:peptidoglycan/xylan/chitin deacetylase (PgdA/CDA1 family)